MQTKKRMVVLKENKISELICFSTFNDRFIFFKNQKFIIDKTLYNIYINKNNLINEICFYLNSTIVTLFIELNGNPVLGEGAMFLNVDDVEILKILNLDYLNLITDLGKKNNIFYREIKSIFEECGFNSNIPIRSQQPNPLPDRKALDDIIFNILELTPEERKEVYWAVCELVQNRLQKANSFN